MTRTTEPPLPNKSRSPDRGCLLTVEMHDASAAAFVAADLGRKVPAGTRRKR